MNTITNIRRISIAFFAAAILLLAPTVSAMTPPACCLDGEQPANTSGTQQTSDHCADMTKSAMHSEDTAETTDIYCGTDCTGACCSAFVSVGIPFSENAPYTYIFMSSKFHMKNVRSASLLSRFPTPPPKFFV